MSQLTASRLSDALRQRLREKRWPQKRLAAHLERDGSTVSLWVSGRKSPRPDDSETVTKLAKFLGTSADHVRNMILSEKTPDPRQPAATQQVGKLEDFDQLLAHNPFLQRIADLHVARPLPSGLRDRLAEEGYLVSEEVATEFLQRNQAPAEPALPRRKRAVPTLGYEYEPLAAIPDTLMGREAVRQACRAVNELFVKANDILPVAQVLAGIAAACETCLESEVAQEVPPLLLEQWLTMRLVRDRGNDMLARAWPLSSEFVLNTMWGLKTGVRNLDFLFDGGVLPPVESGMAIVIKGKAGRGKTMLALQLAASFASQGHCAVFLTAEERASQIASRLSWAGYAFAEKNTPWTTLRKANENPFELLTTNDLDADDARYLTNRMAETNGGVLTLVEISQRKGLFRPSSRMLANLEEIASAVIAKDKIMVTVVDSLDSLEPPPDRRTTDRIFGLSRRTKSVGIYLSEMHDGGAQRAQRDYLADAVIRVGDRDRVGTYIERVVEIEKCRTQSFIRGEHMFGIHGGRGVSVYPSIQSLLSVWRRRVRRLEPVPAESWKVDELDFDPILNGDVVSGSTILLNGPPKTHRLLLGLTFLAAGLRFRPSSHAVLISLREDPASLHRIIANHPQLRDLLDAKDPGLLNPRLRMLHVPPDYFAPERFIHWVQNEFRQYQGESAQGSRVLISSVHQLLHNSPMFEMEKLFVDALLELFKRKRITSMFLGSESEREEEVSSAFDALMFTAHESCAGKEKAVTLRVGHSGPCNADPSRFLLERQMKNDKPRLTMARCPGGGKEQ